MIDCLLCIARENICYLMFAFSDKYLIIRVYADIKMGKRNDKNRKYSTIKNEVFVKQKNLANILLNGC